MDLRDLIFCKSLIFHSFSSTFHPTLVANSNWMAEVSAYDFWMFIVHLISNSYKINTRALKFGDILYNLKRF